MQDAEMCKNRGEDYLHGKDIEGEMMRTIESQIAKAWKDTGNEFAHARNPKCVFWTEQASLKYPFYFNLRRYFEKSGISQKLALVPEYNPTTPHNATCGDKECPCRSTKRRKKQMHIDLCLVEFEKEVLRSNIEYKDYKYRNMWCFKPRPIVAMEFKYYYKFEKWLLNEDVKKLLKMEKVYGAQLLYICFATYERSDITKSLKYIKQIIRQKTSIKAKFRLAVGTLEKNDWKIISIN